MSERIFEGKTSKKFWDAVNSAEPDGPDVLYEYGCKAQEQEAELERLRAMLRQVSKCNTEWEGPNYRTIQVDTSLWNEIQRECSAVTEG